MFDDSLIKLPENEEEMIDALTLEGVVRPKEDIFSFNLTVSVDTSVRVQSTLTLHRQVIDLVQSSRASGITLNVFMIVRFLNDLLAERCHRTSVTGLILVRREFWSSSPLVQNARPSHLIFLTTKSYNY